MYTVVCTVSTRYCVGSDAVRCKAAGIRYFPSHNFRFYGISELFEKGANRNSIQRGSGHADGGMTDAYNRSSSVVEFLNELLESIWS